MSASMTPGVYAVRAFVGNTAIACPVPEGARCANGYSASSQRDIAIAS